MGSPTRSAYMRGRDERGWHWRPLIFLAILVVLLWAASWVFLPKNNTYEDGMEDILTNGYLGEPENSLDVLILGDSIPKFSVIPTELWNKWGMTSYICAGAGSRFPKTLENAERFFETQSPKVVLLDANQLYGRIKPGAALKLWLERRFPLLRYHDNWKKVSPRRMLRPVHMTTVYWEKGYHICKLIEPTEALTHMQPDDGAEMPPEKNLRYLERLMKLCQAHGARLVITSPPTTKVMTMARHNGLKLLTEQYGLLYWNLNLCLEEMKFDWSKNTADCGEHLNYWGAVKVTRALGRRLEALGVPDHRGDSAYAAWDDCYTNFLELAAQAAGSTGEVLPLDWEKIE